MIRKEWLAFPLVVFCLSQCVRATTVTTASCSLSDVQNAVNSASTGDTVLTPGPCSVSWSTAVTIPSTLGITINGGGNTTLTNWGFSINQNSSASTRITGFTFTNSMPAANQGPITVNGSTSSNMGRIDHNTFNDQTDNGTFIWLYGNGPMLIDHDTFTACAACEMIHNMAAGAGDNSGWVDNVTPGSPNMVFIETNTFTYNASGNPAYDYGTAAVQSYYGARTVVRYNSLYMVHIDQHGTAGMVGARWWEIYNNTFYTNVANAAQGNYIALRGGSGVVFNNTHSGHNQATGDIDLYEEDSGTWPLAYQVGSGINGNTNGHNSCSGHTLNSSPAYVWSNTDPDNGGPMVVDSQSPNIVQLNRDYFAPGSQPSSLSRQELSGDTCSTTYNYTPFTYPFPLDVNGLPAPGSQPAPQAPSNLSATVQ